MRILSFIPALAALVTAVASVAVPDACTGSEMKCVSGVGPKRELIQHPSRNLRAMTNAELLRRGLPLNRPVLRRGTPVRRTDPSSVPDDPVRVDPVQVDPVQVDKVTYTGIIEVRDADSDSFLGYISKDLRAECVYDPSISAALLITLQTDRTGDGTQLDISILDSNPNWPLLGLIQDYDDDGANLSPESRQSLYLGGVAKPGTQPGDRPRLIDSSFPSTGTAETAVWTFTSSTGELTPQWVNTDGTYPDLKMWTQSAVLLVGSTTSMDAFRDSSSNLVTPIKFVFVPQ